jgi:predicted DNA-binding protein (UPF0251 family)
MVRPKKNRTVAFDPDVSYFKPRGIPLIKLEEVRLTVDELEAIRLSDGTGLSQEEAGRRMGVSRATFGRIIQNARRLVADALVNGKAIRIEGGTYRLSGDRLQLVCTNCDYRWERTSRAEIDNGCPKCNRTSKHLSDDQET